MSSLDTPKEERDALEQEMRRLKLDGLEQGVHADFSFLVGTNKATAEVRIFNFWA